MFSEYNEVSVKFQLEDINSNFLPLDLCQVLECGVRLLYEDGIHQFDLIMPGFSRFHPLDRDGLETKFQAKRSRSQGMRWDYSVMHRTSEFLAYLQEPNFSKRISSFCLPGDVTPEWFTHQSWGSTVPFQPDLYWANSELRTGFSLCAVIAFRSFSHSLRVKCTFHFYNNDSDSDDLDCYLHDWNYVRPIHSEFCYLHGWNNERRIHLEHIFVGFDPCFFGQEKDLFWEYSKVLVEFQLEDMDDNLLPLDLCQVVECGVRLLHTYDRLEAMFQAKRETVYDFDMR